METGKPVLTLFKLSKSEGNEDLNLSSVGGSG